MNNIKSGMVLRHHKETEGFTYLLIKREEDTLVFWSNAHKNGYQVYPDPQIVNYMFNQVWLVMHD